MRRWVLLGLLLLVTRAAEALPVVPGAFGFGMDTRAAYACGSSPTVIKVTSLADTNTAGTLRYALLQTGPRVVVFETSGYIDITSDINVVEPCLTVAGQTAPSPGITVRMSSGVSPEKIIVINAHDVLIQHIRFRPGGDSCNSGPLIVYSYILGVPTTLFYNVVMDHVSMSWGQDEGLYAGRTDQNGGNSNVTFWRTIAGEGLFNAPLTSPPVCGGTLGDEPANGHGIFIEGQQIDVIQSLMSTNRERNPMLDTNFSTRLLNNIIYNWQGEWGIFAFNKYDYGPWSLTAVGNRFITGPSSNSNSNVGGAVKFWWGSAYMPSGPGDAGNQAYLSDNTVSDVFSTTILETNQGHGFDQLPYNPAVGSPPSAAPMPTGYTTIASSALEAYLLPKLGARPLDRDSVDTRIVSNITNRTGPSTPSGYVIVPSDVGGYPTLAVNSRSFTTVGSPHVDAGDGYTNLEHQLHAAAALVEDAAPSGPADVAPAAGAVIVSATFTGTAGAALTSVTNTIGGGWALQPGSTGVFQLSNAGRVMNTSTGVPALTLAAGVPLSTQYDLDVDMRVLTLIPGSSYSAWARVSVTVGGVVTGEYVVYDVDSATWTLTAVVSDAYSPLGSCSQALSPNTTYHVTERMRDTTKHLVIDGVQCTSARENSVPLTGLAGLSAYEATTASTNTTGIHFDNFVVTDVMSATAPPGPPKLRVRWHR